MPTETIEYVATEEPVSLARLKLHLRVTTEDDDARLTQFLVAARQWVENETRRGLMRQRLRLLIDTWQDEVTLPVSGVISVDAVKYYDTGNTLRTLDPSAYDVDLASRPPRIAPAFGVVWPIPYPRYNAVRIEFTTGAADAGTPDAAAVDASITTAILLKAGDLVEGADNEKAIRSILSRSTPVS